MASGTRILLPITYLPVAIGLYVLAVLSPLLTLLRFWQIKEWRFDRLLEHLNAEGWLLPLFGRLRPVIALLLLSLNVWLYAGLQTATGEPDALGTAMASVLLSLTGLGLCAALSVLQLLSRKRQVPRWTAKALLLAAVALALNGVTAWLLWPWMLWLYPAALVAQPVMLLGAWMIVWPADAAAKQHILQKAAIARRTLPNIAVIAVCGSVGKTTTKELLSNALFSVFPLVTPEHVNSELGVAQWFLREHAAGRVRPGGTLVVEMGGYRKGEVKKLCSVMRPTMGIVTSVGTQHIALYGSKENILAAEREMPASLPKDGLLILNGDNPECKALASAAACLTVTVGTQEGDDLRATDISETAAGLTLQADDRTLTVPLHGMHNITNVLCAYAAAKAAGLDGADIAGALAQPLSTSHTFHVSARGGVTVLDDTHNSSPQSVAAAVSWAAQRAEKPRVLLTTTLIEQGSNEAEEMQTYGSQAKDVFDRVVFVSERGRRAFEHGYGKPTERPGANIVRVPAGGLLAGVGRVPRALLESLLP